MTQAAELYSKDMDVLEQARKELHEYLDEVGAAIVEKVTSAWQNGEATSSLGKLEVWSNSANPTLIVFGVPVAGGSGVYVQIVGPRQNRADHRYYSVSITTGGVPNFKKLQRHVPGLLPQLERLAQDSGLAFNRDNTRQRTEESVPVRADDSSVLADEVAKRAYERLLLLVQLRKWAATSKKKA